MTVVWKDGAVQLDLFGEVEAAEAATAAAEAEVCRQAVEFLTSPWRDLLEWILDPDRVESRLDHGETKARCGEGFAYAVWKDGLRFERRSEWSRGGGWSRRPVHCIGWDELRATRDRQPDLVGKIHELAQGRTDQSWWRWRMQPFIITIGSGWHRSYIDHERPDGYYRHVPHVPGELAGQAYADRLWAWYYAVRLVSTHAH